MLENLLTLLIAAFIIWKIGFKVYEDFLSINDNNTPVYKKIDLFRINTKITNAYDTWAKFSQSYAMNNKNADKERADKAMEIWSKNEKIYYKMVQVNIDVSLGKKTVQEARDEIIFDDLKKD